MTAAERDGAADSTKEPTINELSQREFGESKMRQSYNKTHATKGGRLVMTPSVLTKDAGAPPVTMEASGTVAGYASTFDREPDSYGDVVAKGAFKRTLAEWRAVGKPIPLLYGHNTDDPMHNIGRVTEAREDARGLYVEAEFDVDNPIAQYARKLAAEGRLYQFSFGYDVRDYGPVTLADGTRVNELRDIDLYEVSLVQVPANQHAVITDVKGMRGTDKRELARLRKEARELLERIEREEALEYARATLEAIEILNS